MENVPTTFDSVLKSSLDPIIEVEESDGLKPLLAKPTAKPRLQGFIKKMTINMGDSDGDIKPETELGEIQNEALIDEISSTRHQFLDTMHSKMQQNVRKITAQKKAEARECEFGLKMERGYLKYKIMFNIMFIPLWSSFLLIFLSYSGGDIVNIIYFCLTPIDTLMDGCLSRQFLSSVNGIMVNTHRKMFKYRSKIGIIITLA
jgi:hypothetical protein